MSELEIDLEIYFHVTSRKTDYYNCLAWAAGENKRWWQPDDPWDQYYWPPEAPRSNTLYAHIKAYESKGFVGCTDGDLEVGFIKIALFVTENEVIVWDHIINKLYFHAARQLPNGKWTSKCGIWEDIEHDLTEVCGPPLNYGDIACFMKKPA